VSAVIVDGVLYGLDAEMARWVFDRVPHATTPPEACTAMGVMVSGELAAGVAWHSHTGLDVQVAVAAENPRWARKATLGKLFAYPFVQLGCRRITASTGADNHRTQRFLTGLGFVLEGTLRCALPNDLDALVFGMLREDCTWIET
jgi:hypothetical protein